ncbi:MULTISPECIES: response regulator [Spirosoma]|uniref:Response regulator n=1 Tax=Spirosoma liriopis TaxID=2937440 RepID=A0ABT0HFB1_9BACT|nr:MULTISPECIES: response regulator [Spirosoma]MCK8490845.1 response regulator [Spirosoma liriopis]UHG90231.1 response regulator [Spirosoma oryzicola]
MTDQTQQRAIHILLVDDDEDDRYLTREAFHQHYPSSRISFAEDGEDLLDFLNYKGRYAQSGHTLPELILLDLNMPRKDGREALREIKANDELRHIPIVVLTTSDAKDDIETSYFNGANSFITKPPTFQRLSEVTKAIGQYWFNVVTVCDHEVEG